MRYSLTIRAAATAIALSAGVAEAQPAPNGTITGDTIVIGQYADQSGPNAPTGAARYGLEAYIASVNAKGGVDGKKLRLVSYDDGYKPSQTVALVKKLVYEDGAFAITGVGTPTSNAVAPVLEDLGVPLVAMSTGSPVFYDPLRAHVFPAWPLYTTDGKTMAEFVKTHLHSKKTGVIYQDDGFGRPILAAVKQTLGDAVDTSAYTPGQLDFSDALLKFKNDGVDAIVIAAIAPPAAQILNALTKLDYHPARVLTSSACGYTSIFTTIPSLDGAYCAAFLPTPDASNPRWRPLASAMAKYEDGKPAEIYAAWGWLSGEVIVEGLRRIRGPITRDAYVKALESIKDFPTIGGPLTYSHEKHAGICCQSVWQAKGGRWIAVPGSNVDGTK